MYYIYIFLITKTLTKIKMKMENIKIKILKILMKTLIVSQLQYTKITLIIILYYIFRFCAHCLGLCERISISL